MPAFIVHIGNYYPKKSMFESLLMIDCCFKLYTSFSHALKYFFTKVCADISEALSICCYILLMLPISKGIGWLSNSADYDAGFTHILVSLLSFSSFQSWCHLYQGWHSRIWIWLWSEFAFTPLCISCSGVILVPGLSAGHLYDRMWFSQL